MDARFIIGFFGWPVIIAATIYLNWYRINKRKLKPDYLSSNLSRAVFGLICLILMSAQDGFNGIDFAYPRTLIRYIPNMIYILSSFYLFFDAGLNGLRGKAWDYKGDDSGWMDSLGIAFYHIVKAVSFIGVMWSIITLWRK